MEIKQNEIHEDNLLKILVATDSHLGYGEKDVIRGEDSFIAFEECLQHAQENDADFILLGGDLFHDANPTQNSLHRCLKLLRMYTMGDKPIMVEFLSDQTVNFLDSLNKTVNYEDPNMNIAIPVFSIHGNHDDPSGFGRLSSLDILSMTGLVNYFGKWVDLKNVEINPIMIRKGDTKLALYGLSHIHDTRLHRLFSDGKVVMNKPEGENNLWFNLMVLHQNRADRGPKSYLPEEILPEFLDLVIWGHEHDCRIIPEENDVNHFFVSQPGSSVATSMAEGEATEKHCGLLLIHQKQFKLEPIKLKTVRPFIFESMNLVDHVDELEMKNCSVQEAVQELVAAKIEEMIEKSKQKLTGHPKQPKEPLIRLRVQYSDENQLFNTIRFGQQYTGKVANPIEMVMMKKLVKKQKYDTKAFDRDIMEGAFDREKIENNETRVEDIVHRYFEEVEGAKNLEILSATCLSEICRRLVDYDDDDAAEKLIEFHKDRACQFLNENVPTENDLSEVLLDFKNQSEQIFKDALDMLDKRGQSTNRRQTGRDSFMDINDESDDEIPFVPNVSKPPPIKATSTKTTSRGRGRGSRGGKAGTTSNRTELNVTTAGKRQQSITDSFSQRSTTKSKKKVVYESDSN